jgi:hypothetical protein
MTYWLQLIRRMHGIVLEGWQLGTIGGHQPAVAVMIG